MAAIPSNLPQPFDFSQAPLLIEHSIDGGEVIPQRPTDGYINATAPGPANRRGNCLRTTIDWRRPKPF